MAEYGYTTVPSKLRPLLEKIGVVGVPAKATQAWLASVGFSSTNDRSLLSVLRQLGFVDASGRPTGTWEDYRAGKSGVLAAAIRAGFSPLFETYPDAQKRSNADLEGVIKGSAPKLGKEAVSRVVSTFRHLVALAEFDVVEVTGEGERDVRQGVDEGVPPTASRGQDGGPGGVTVRVNVQFVLPETTDANVYERLFSAMRRYLLEGVNDGS